MTTQSSTLPYADIETANHQLRVRVKELEELKDRYRVEAEMLRRHNAQLSQIINAETPIGALTLADTWAAEKQAYMEQIEGLTKALDELSAVVEAAEFIIPDARTKYSFSAQFSTLFMQELSGYDNALARVSSNPGQSSPSPDRRDTRPLRTPGAGAGGGGG